MKEKDTKKPEKEPKYTADSLAGCKRFAHIQKDFFRAALGDGCYTMAEAEKIAEKYKGGR